MDRDDVDCLGWIEIVPQTSRWDNLRSAPRWPILGLSWVGQRNPKAVLACPKVDQCPLGSISDRSAW